MIFDTKKRHKKKQGDGDQHTELSQGGGALENPCVEGTLAEIDAALAQGHDDGDAKERQARVGQRQKKSPCGCFG